MQYVCKVCGYNMVGYYPENCPFCGASNDNFITAEECSSSYNVKKTKVSDKVFRINSTPSLGLEHSAYQIKMKNKIIWIDCPSTFKKEVSPLDAIIFTHHHFLGASNLYQKYFNCEVWIHEEDSTMNLAKHHSFTRKFKEDFILDDLNAFHIDGHTRGFTFYVFEDILFECDYTFFSDQTLKFNPYGNQKNTYNGGLKMKEIIQKFDLNIVCGVDYVVEFDSWFLSLKSLLNK